MKNRNMVVGTLAALCLLCGGARATETSDTMITAKIKAELAGHKSVSAISTHVETSDGVVTLSGSAHSSAEKELVERYVRDVEGVKGVDNQIAVKEARNGKSAADPDADRGAGSRLLDKVGDGSISSEVKSALKGHQGTRAMSPTVETRDGVVTLYGTATSDAQKDLAERLAMGVSGVKSVDNEINVKTPGDN